MASNLVVFDGHNDVLLRLFNKQGNGVEQEFLTGEKNGQVDYPRSLAGGFAGGFFAIFVPSDEEIAGIEELMRGEAYDVPLSRPISAVDALPKALTMASVLLRIERQSGGRFKVCRTAAEIRACLKANVMAAVMHIEGAEPIDPDFHVLDVLYEAGLRSVGPVWSRSNQFGHGVPFRFPSSPDTGPGLTDLGKKLIASRLPTDRDAPNCGCA